MNTNIEQFTRINYNIIKHSITFNANDTNEKTIKYNLISDNAFEIVEIYFYLTDWYNIEKYVKQIIIDDEIQIFSGEEIIEKVYSTIKDFCDNRSLYCRKNLYLEYIFIPDNPKTINIDLYIVVKSFTTQNFNLTGFVEIPD